MKVIVTGATGFIGVPVVRALLARGHEVTALVRDPTRARSKLPERTKLVAADLETQGPWCDELDGANAIIHLAGEPIAAKRWDARQKQLIRDSRVESTRTLVEIIAKLPPERRPQVLVSASAVDYYAFASGPGDFDDDEVTETDPSADTFLGRVCRDWENEARAAEPLGVRVVCMRTALVLGPGGGVLDRLKKPFQMFAGGRLGDGRQWMSWIALEDAVEAYVMAVESPAFKGPLNLVADSTRNAELARTLGRVLHKPSWLPVPAFAIKAAVGSELAESLLEGRRVVPAKLRELGFRFKHPTLDGAIAAALQ